MAERSDAGLVAGVKDRLAEEPPPSDELRLAGALTNRMVAYVGSAEIRGLPEPHSSAGD